MSRRIDYIISELKDQYLIDDGNRPWIIGFSGGKDSTALLQLTWYALKELHISQLKREVFVVCNDTLVENPIVVNYVDKVLDKIQQASTEQGLPIRVQKTIPRLEDSFG